MALNIIIIHGTEVSCRIHKNNFFSSILFPYFFHYWYKSNDILESEVKIIDVVHDQCKPDDNLIFFTITYEVRMTYV